MTSGCAKDPLRLLGIEDGLPTFSVMKSGVSCFRLALPSKRGGWVTEGGPSAHRQRREKPGIGRLVLGSW